MATFAKQASKLGALNGALTSYSRILDVSNDIVDGTTKAEHQTTAERFLQQQRSWVDVIDESLLRATEDILPESRDIKTVTELAELCRLVQEFTRQKTSLLHTRLELMGVKTTWDESFMSSPPPLQSTAEGAGLIQWSVGAALECVVEGDVETEGATTPGSLLHPSPFTSATKRKPSLTPTTPTMDRFSFSASTASILEQMNLQQSTSESTRRASTTGSRHSVSPAATGRRRSNHNQLNFEGFQEEDDMITLHTIDSQSTPANNKINTTGSPVVALEEERSQFLARMESMSERVEEELIHESRLTDEASIISKESSKTNRQIQRPSNIKFLEELDHQEYAEPEEEQEEFDDEEEFDDDSTNVVATQVASLGEPRMLVGDADKLDPISQNSTAEGKNIRRPVPVFHRPTQIVVETGMPSPAHTNITMDATILNDTMLSMSMMADDDNLSTVTPILDRYRLDVDDDNSIGIKVVPNRRRGQERVTYLGGISEIIPEVATPLPEYSTDHDGFRSPKGLPGSVSARKKKEYRKTPFPKKQLDHNFQSLDDENGHPNIRGVFSTNNPVLYDSSNPESSFSVPPLRPRSYGPGRTQQKEERPTSRALSLPASSALPKTPSAVKAVESPDTLRLGKWMEKITMAEYDVAPRVVQMQVTRDDANRALDMIESFLTSTNQTSLEFSEEQGYEVLSDLLNSEQKCKSVLMSLCHWRRLVMYRHEHYGKVFAVNQFEQ